MIVAKWEMYQNIFGNVIAFIDEVRSIEILAVSDMTWDAIPVRLTTVSWAVKSSWWYIIFDDSTDDNDADETWPGTNAATQLKWADEVWQDVKSAPCTADNGWRT